MGAFDYPARGASSAEVGMGNLKRDRHGPFAMIRILFRRLGIALFSSPHLLLSCPSSVAVYCGGWTRGPWLVDAPKTQIFIAFDLFIWYGTTLTMRIYLSEKET